MLGLAGVLALVATAAEVTVTVVPGAPCVTEAVLMRKLLEAGLQLPRLPSATTVRVTLQRERGQLWVQGRRGTLRFERRVPASLDDCPAVLRVTVALISAWAATPTSETVDAGPPPVPMKPAPIAEIVSTPEPSPIIVRALETPPAPIEALNLDAGTPEPDAGSELTPDDAGIPLALEVVSVDAWRLEAAGLGGFNAGPSPAITFAGSLLAGLSLRRWGVLLEGGLETARTARQDPIEVSASLQWVSVSVRAVFEPLSSVSVDVALGARGWRLAASATGVTTAFDQVELTAGPAVSAGLSWHLAGPLFVHFRPSAAWRVQQFSLKVEPAGQLLLIGPWSVGASLGALLRFE